MTTIVEGKINHEIREILLSEIMENTWNPNVMPAEAFEALLEDMRKGGPEAIDPILLAVRDNVYKLYERKDMSLDTFYVILNGKHRFNAAQKLGWPTIRAFVDENVEGEPQARLISYAKNAERGNMDPYKLAEYFKWFVDEGQTQEEIAKRHRIDRTTVTKVLSLLKIAPDVKEKLNKVPYITISHLEPIATAPHHVQREVVKQIGKRDQTTVAEITRTTKHITEQFEKAERLRKAVATAKFPKCPQCGKAPKEFDYNWDGKKNQDNVRCENWHKWSLSEGVKQERPISSGSASGESKIPQSIHSERSLDEFIQAFRGVVDELLPTIAEIDDIEISGKGEIEFLNINGKAGKKIRKVVDELLPSLGKIEDIDASGKNRAGHEVSLHSNFEWGNLKVDVQGGEKFNMSVVKTSIKDNPKIKTRVSGSGWIQSKTDLAKLKRQVQELFEK